MMRLVRCLGLAASASGVRMDDSKRDDAKVLVFERKGGLAMVFPENVNDPPLWAQEPMLLQAIAQGDGELAYRLLRHPETSENIDFSLRNREGKSALELAEELMVPTDEPDSSLDWDDKALTPRQRWINTLGHLITGALRQKKANPDFDVSEYLSDAVYAINEYFVLAIKRGQMEHARYYLSIGANPNDVSHSRSRHSGGQYRTEGIPMVQWLTIVAGRTLGNQYFEPDRTQLGEGEGLTWGSLKSELDPLTDTAAPAAPYALRQEVEALMDFDLNVIPSWGPNELPTKADTDLVPSNACRAKMKGGGKKGIEMLKFLLEHWNTFLNPLDITGAVERALTMVLDPRATEEHYAALKLLMDHQAKMEKLAKIRKQQEQAWQQPTAGTRAAAAEQHEGKKSGEGEQTDQGVRDDPRIVEFPYENARVLVFGLTNIHYNEQKGVALKYFPDKGRWKV